MYIIISIFGDIVTQVLCVSFLIIKIISISLMVYIFLIYLNNCSCNMKKGTPMISCIMTTFNSSEFLQESINSILNQSFSDFEFIISDWWSSDNTCDIIRSFEKKDSRIVFLENKKRKWIADCLNDCVKMAKGGVIAIMESDDVSYKDRFEQQYWELLSHNCDIVFSAWSVWDVFWDVKYTREYNKNFFHNSLYCLMIEHQLVACSMFKKSLRYEIWWFWTFTWDFKFFFDMKFWKNNTKIGFIDNPLYFKRANPEWASWNGLKFFQSVKENRKYAVKKYNLSKRYYINIYYNYILFRTTVSLISLSKKLHVYSLISPIWRKILSIFYFYNKEWWKNS